MYKSTIAGIGQTAEAQSPGYGAALKSAATKSSWYNKVAQAFGAALDRQAAKTVALAENLNVGDDAPGTALQVSAAAHQLSFLSTAASTASNSIGQALETLGRKQ